MRRRLVGQLRERCRALHEVDLDRPEQVAARRVEACQHFFEQRRVVVRLLTRERDLERLDDVALRERVDRVAPGGRGVGSRDVLELDRGGRDRQANAVQRPAARVHLP